MSFESFENFQYDSCTSRGICSINPRTSALQGVLILYLKFISKYALNLYNREITDTEVKDLILQTLAITVSNQDFDENSFSTAVLLFKQELPKIIEKYNNEFEESNFSKEKLSSLELFQHSDDITQAIRYGEKELQKTFIDIPIQVRDLYGLMLIIAKSISINLMDLESFDKEYNDGFLTVLKLLEKLDIEEKDITNLKQSIFDAANVDNKIMRLLRAAQEERYGTQIPTEVSYSTTPAKAALVVGSNIRELETILEALKNTDIDVYTHDDMILAHTFPEFSKYKHLKGQYGQGIENCLLDFSTFPGPIILTKHSLHNIENFYRGRLFTTDYTNPKGVIKIENNNFSEVIKSALEARGFKTGKECETDTIGYDYNDIKNTISEKITQNSFSKILLIGPENYSQEQRIYFEKLIKLVPQDILIISFSYNFEKKELIHLNACFDSYSIIKFYDFLKQYNIPIMTFVPKCERDSISQMIYLAQNQDTKVFVGQCTPIILNPSLLNTLQELFNIRNITTAKKDIEFIMENK